MGVRATSSRPAGSVADRPVGPAAARATRPLTQLPTDALINSLSGDYLHALVCKAALHAFAAENEARMEAMSAAGSQITRELGEFEATLRRVRQEAITAEIIELGTGTASARDARLACPLKSGPP
jgi:F-type H+-transporting ATPase subunit gamma